MEARVRQRPHARLIVKARFGHGNYRRRRADPVRRSRRDEPRDRALVRTRPTSCSRWATRASACRWSRPWRLDCQSSRSTRRDRPTCAPTRASACCESSLPLGACRRAAVRAGVACAGYPASKTSPTRLRWVAAHRTRRATWAARRRRGRSASATSGTRGRGAGRAGGAARGRRARCGGRRLWAFAGEGVRGRRVHGPAGGARRWRRARVCQRRRRTICGARVLHVQHQTAWSTSGALARASGWPGQRRAGRGDRAHGARRRAPWERDADALVSTPGRGGVLRARWPSKRVEHIPHGCPTWFPPRKRGAGGSSAHSASSGPHKGFGRLLDVLRAALGDVELRAVLPRQSPRRRPEGRPAAGVPVALGARVPRAPEDVARGSRARPTPSCTGTRTPGCSRRAARCDRTGDGHPGADLAHAWFCDVRDVTYQPADLEAGLARVLDDTRAARTDSSTAAARVLPRAPWENGAAARGAVAIARARVTGAPGHRGPRPTRHRRAGFEIVSRARAGRSARVGPRHGVQSAEAARTAGGQVCANARTASYATSRS